MTYVLKVVYAFRQMENQWVAERARSLLMEAVIVKAREATTRELTMMLWPFNELNRNALLTVARKQAKDEEQNGQNWHSRAFEAIE